MSAKREEDTSEMEEAEDFWGVERDQNKRKSDDENNKDDDDDDDIDGGEMMPILDYWFFII